MEMETAVFAALRERLTRQINASDAADADAARVNRLVNHDDGAPRGPGAMFAQLAAQHRLSVETKPAMDSLRDRRTRFRLRRKRLTQRVRDVQNFLEAALNDERERVANEADAFRTHVEASHAHATQRLEALCVECVTELHKAVDRARNALATHDQNDANDLKRQRDALHATLAWRVFLARLREDTQCGLETAMLLPGPTTPETSRLTAELAQLIALNGPVRPENENAVLDTVIAVADRRETNSSGDDKRGARKASLHYVDSMAAAWTDITASLRPPVNPTKARRSAPSVPNTMPVPYSGVGGNERTSLRRVIASPSVRISNYPLDTPLSCSAIQWLLPRLLCSDTEDQKPQTLRDLNVYVDVREWSEDPAQIIPSDGTTELAELARNRHEELCGLARAATVDVSSRSRILLNNGAVVARATVLELVQTSYARTHFLPLLEDDVEHVNTACVGCQPWFRALPTISTLYVAVETSSDGTVRLVALDAICLHELCVLHVARGISTKKSTRWAPTSLTKADAFSIVPSAKADNVAFCVVRRSPSLFRLTQEYPWLGPRSALFVEYHLEGVSSGFADDGHPSVGITKKREVLRLLGPRCAWRSCLDTVTQATLSNGLLLCEWHRSLRSSVHDASHFLPNLKELKTCLKPVEEQREVETIKKVLIKSSSLLEELTSRQLSQSIAAFLQHAESTLSNAGFEANLGYQGDETFASSDETDSDTSDAVAIRRARLETATQVLHIEQAVTTAIEAAVASGDALPTGFELEWNDLDHDIRTDNYELILELSRRKLALLQYRPLVESARSRITHSVSDGAIGMRNGPTKVKRN